MKLRQLNYLLAIADNGLNITAAAERLYTSQPGVSKQLKLLEEELGLQLFTRRGKSLESVTPAGQVVIERARLILQEVENIRSLAASLSNEETGTLSIGTTHTQARYVLPEVIQQFRARYPNVTLDLHQGTSEQIAEMVEARHIDFAIATGSRHLFGGLVLLPCYHWDRVIIAPKSHPLTELGHKPTLAQLAEHPLVTYVFSFSGESSLKKAFEVEGLEPDVVFTARDADVIKTYVRMGLGVGIVASMAQDCDDDGNLVALDAKGLFPRSTTWIGFRRDAVLRHFMVDFIELFAPHLTPELTEQAAGLADQQAVDALLDGVKLPVKGRCAQTLTEVV